jgi:hypothetical protein
MLNDFATPVPGVDVFVDELNGLASRLLGDTAIISMPGGRVAQIDMVAERQVGETLETKQLESAHLAVSPDGGVLAYASTDGVALFSLDGRQLLAQALPNDDLTAGVSSDEEGKVYVWHRAPLDVTKDGASRRLEIWDVDAEPPTRREVEVAGTGPIGSGGLGGYSGGGVFETLGGVNGRRWQLRDAESLELLFETPDVFGFPANHPERGVFVLKRDGAFDIYDLDSSALGDIVLMNGSRNGRFLLTEDLDRAITIRDPGSFAALGDPLPPLEDIGWSRYWLFDDGSHLVATSPAEDLILYDVEARRRVGGGFPGRFAQLGSSGAYTMTEAAVLIWNLDSGEWFDIACRAAGRNMTVAEWGEFGPTDADYRPTCPQWPIDQ